jgi:hypothetical protein
MGKCNPDGELGQEEPALAVGGEIEYGAARRGTSEHLAVRRSFVSLLPSRSGIPKAESDASIPGAASRNHETCRPFPPDSDCTDILRRARHLYLYRRWLRPFLSRPRRFRYGGLDLCMPMFVPNLLGCPGTVWLPRGPLFGATHSTG